VVREASLGVTCTGGETFVATSALKTSETTSALPASTRPCSSVAITPKRTHQPRPPRGVTAACGAGPHSFDGRLHQEPIRRHEGSTMLTSTPEYVDAIRDDRLREARAFTPRSRTRHRIPSKVNRNWCGALRQSRGTAPTPTSPEPAVGYVSRVSATHSESVCHGLTR
jgi:hypothetical protein